jgi:hypothetical protein
MKHRVKKGRRRATKNRLRVIGLHLRVAHQLKQDEKYRLCDWGSGLKLKFCHGPMEEAIRRMNVVAI